MKKLSTFSGISLGVSMVVGTGILSLTGMAIDIAGPRGSIFGWIAAAVAIAPFLLVFARLSQAFPNATGLADCAAQAFGNWAGRGLSVLLLTNILLTLPAVGLIGGAYLERVLLLPAGSAVMIAIVLLACATAINLIDRSRPDLLSQLSLGMLFLLLLLLVISHPLALTSGFAVFRTADEHVEVQKLWQATALVIFAFLGWENLTFATADFKRPKKIHIVDTIPRTATGMPSKSTRVSAVRLSPETAIRRLPSWL